jgi:hypothetical protein
MVELPIPNDILPNNILPFLELPINSRYHNSHCSCGRLDDPERHFAMAGTNSALEKNSRRS